ncbi:MAG TPA: iron-containing alcohol dehydrogenase [Candidatus Copromorpha excrementigallinarum]|uniref:Iron-containing alcohol dehydrogenase n=1 Tax=Candidatus Allocopromorpha excrementigallinarum TaxID=2840742 RepID=A0A9D1L5Q2_9FIRM|nr:iron-containing alcohol dehydrogenase [Candidatus Copromorpha excrementigallinarum]
MGFERYSPTRIVFGAGTLNKLNEQLMPGEKALLVISNGKSTKVNGYLDRCVKQLEKAGVEYVIFDRIEANPLNTTVMQGAKKARETGCDFIVALGGGSVMDASKAIATMVTNEGTLWDYMTEGTGKKKPISNTPAPIVAITTTAGTGSEVDSVAVISNKETDEKMAFGGIESLNPVLAIVDPELMTSVPPKFTAYQGFDALFHSTEGYISRMNNLMGDMHAITAIKNIGKYLSRAVKDGKDMESREGVAFANTLSGMVMELSSCTSEHSMEHAMSAYHHELPHGAGLIMLSEAYYQYFADRHACDERMIEMARALGKEDAKEAQDFVDALRDLQKACGVDGLKMSDFGIKEDELEKMAENARETLPILFDCDPVRMSHEDCVEIFRKAYK